MTGSLMTEAHSADEALDAPPPLDLRATSLFLDLDGTIAPLEPAPQDVGPDRDRRRLLDALRAELDGRLAVVSGRTLADLDRVLEGRIPALGAVHGLVRRSADGRVCQSAGAGAVHEAVVDFRAFAAADRRLLVEDKGVAVTLHYRQAPEAAAAARDVGRRLAGRLGLRALEGDMVIELRAQGPDKGGAVAAFMTEPPFAGFTPIFVGDDLTDEDGFRAARRLGGYGIIAGARRPSDASFALGGVEAVRAWLAAAVRRSV
jgi:trehalose 6-phosphate phosphatase